jgi:multidrug efflux pump subunit AcrB
MTTIAAIFALMPLAIIGMGVGSEMLKPLAVALVSGHIIQIPLALLVLPVLLLMFQLKLS